jgi:hypothetical protein
VPLAGQVVKASDIPSIAWDNKAAAESVTNSTTLQNDDDFSIALPVGTWRITAILTVSGAAAGDVRVAWTNTGTMSAVGRSCIGPGQATTDAAGNANNATRMVATTLTAQMIYGTDGTSSSAIIEELVLEVTAEGVLTMQWAQGTSSGTSTTLSTSCRFFRTPLAAI